jgi:spermidine/putrescine transport system permease protein
MDLGAKPGQSIRRVLLPLLSPAILASVAVTFADSVDDFVIVRYLSGPASSEPLSVKIYSAARSSPTPAVNAAATVMLLATMAMIVVGYLIYRHFAKGTGDAGDMASFTQL